MQLSDFKTPEALAAYNERAKKYFHEHYHIGALYNQSRAAIPMLLHIWEQGDRTNELLSKILNTLQANVKEGGGE